VNTPEEMKVDEKPESKEEKPEEQPKAEAENESKIVKDDEKEEEKSQSKPKKESKKGKKKEDPVKVNSQKKDDEKKSQDKKEVEKKSQDKKPDNDGEKVEVKTDENKKDEQEEKKPEEEEKKNNEKGNDDDDQMKDSKDEVQESKKEGSKAVAPAKAKKSPRRKDEKNTTENEEKKKLKSPKKKARSTPNKKSKARKNDDDDEEEEEDDDEMDMKLAEDDEDEDEMFDDEEDDEDPEDEDVEGKGYGHVLMFTRMPGDVRSKLVTGVKQIPDGYMTRNIKFATHVVCDEPVRTIKLMAAILRGVWIVSSKWVLDSIEAKKWLPESSYEIQQFPGVKLSREAHENAGVNEHVSGPFNGMSFVIGHTDHTSPTKSEIKELVLAGDGYVFLTKDIDKAQYYISCPSRLLPTNLPETALVVSQNAFFDAISNYTVPVSTPASKLAAQQSQEKKEAKSSPEDSDSKP